jgi:hypothetical protein
MKKSVATYVLGVVVGSVLGLGSLAAASSTFWVPLIKYDHLLGYGNCSTSGGIPIWTDDDWVGNDSETSDMWVTCRDIARSDLGGPAAVRRVVLYLYDSNRDSNTRVQAYMQCTKSGSPLPYMSDMKKVAGAYPHDTQTLTFTNPWPTGCTTSLIKILLPAKGLWYEPAVGPFKVTYH